MALSYYFFFGSFFCSFSNWRMLFEGVGKFSGIVPPSSAIVCLTLRPTSKWVLFASPFSCTWSRRNFSSVCVARKRLAASSVLPIWSRICSFFFRPFRWAIFCAVRPPYSPLYPHSEMQHIQWGFSRRLLLQHQPGNDYDDGVPIGWICVFDLL